MNLSFENEIYTKLLNEVNKNLSNSKTCPICRDPLNFDDLTLGCNHSYHSSCLINSFNSYETKRCLLCNTSFSLNKYENICSKIMKNNKQCTKKCYNSQKLCNLHIKQLMNETNKKKDKAKILIKKKNEKISILKNQIDNLIKEIAELKKIDNSI